MLSSRMTLRAAAFCHALAAAAILVPADGLAQEADPADKAIKTRQGFMQLVLWSAGPLFGMAKGDVAYDAATAEAHAANLKALTQFSFPSLFVEGTSKEARPGKTRALPAIWADNAKFAATFADLGAAADKLVTQAGAGQPELAAAVGELGGACGACHKGFRAKDF